MNFVFENLLPECSLFITPKSQWLYGKMRTSTCTVSGLCVILNKFFPSPHWTHKWLAFVLQHSIIQLHVPFVTHLMLVFCTHLVLSVKFVWKYYPSRVLKSCLVIFTFKKEVLSLIELGCDQSALLRHDLCCWLRN